MPTTATRTQWLLEIAKGAEPGRRYALERGETTVGNGPWSPGYLSLADQEGPSPRRMVAKQAAIRLEGDAVAIRDLDSPGGTFVNRRRLFTGQEQALAPGDVVQLGAVQLVVRHERAEAARPPAPPAASKPAPPSRPQPTPAAAPTPPAPAPVRTGPMTAPYAFPDGSACRGWDDFLALSSQRWAMIRDELASGRLGEHLKRVGRADLMPRREPGWTADDVLDDWLGRLPTKAPAAPELDVHPGTLAVPAAAAGGVVRRSFRIANVGHRILRPTVAAEPAPGFPGAIRLAPGWAGQSFATIDETEVVVEIAAPEDAVDVALGAIVVRGAGSSRRIVVRVEPRRAEEPPAGVEPAAGPGWSSVVSLGERLEGLSVARRFWAFPLAVLLLRGLVGLGNRLPYLSGGGDLRLAGAAALPALAGGILGWAVGSRGGFLDGLASTFAGAVVGVLASSVAFAAIRSVETVFGPPPLAALAFGLALAALSCLIFPPRGRKEPS